MMTFYYWISMLFGSGVVAVLLIRQQKMLRERRIIERQQNSSDNKVLVRIDYVALIVKNNRLLTVLDGLDKRLDLKLRIFAGAVLFLLALKMVGVLPLSSRAMGMTSLLVMVAIIVLPVLFIKPLIHSKVKQMMDSLPYFIDLVAVCVQSGMTVESSLKYIGERFSHLDENLSSLILQVVKRAEVSGLEEALHELYRSMNMTEIRMFTSTLQQSVHYGTSLYENLMELSKDIRELQLLITEENIGKLSARMSVPLILFIMLPITVLIVAPGILRIMKNGLF